MSHEQPENANEARRSPIAPRRIALIVAYTLRTDNAGISVPVVAGKPCRELALRQRVVVAAPFVRLRIPPGGSRVSVGAAVEGCFPYSPIRPYNVHTGTSPDFGGTRGA